MTTFSVLALETISSANVVTGLPLMLTNNADYALVSCDLGITARKRSALGGASPYTDVPVELAVHVIGSTAALCAAAMERLITMVAQARRWENRENVDGVRLRMRLQGGGTDYICMLLGPPDGEPPTSFAIEEVAINSVNVFMVRDVMLRFIRRGLLYKTTAVTATSSATALKTVGSCTFAASSDIPVPTVLKFTPASAEVGFKPGLLVVTALNGIQRVNAKDGSLTGSVVSFADSAANRSVSGNVARFTAPGGTAAIPISTVTWTQIAVFATVRVNTVGGAWDLTSFIFSGGASAEFQNNPRRVEYNGGDPVTVFLGFFSSLFGFQTSITIDAVGNTGTMDIDCVYIARTDLPAYILDIRGAGGVGFFREPTFPGQIQPRDEYDRQPFVGQTDAGGTPINTYSYNGDVFITSSGTGLSFVALDGGYLGAWREGSAGVSYTDTVVATRYPSALTPQ